MTGGWTPIAWLVAIPLCGCSALNRIEACEDEPRERRVNERIELSEFTSHPKAAALLHSGDRVMAAYLSQNADATQSSVHLVLLDAVTGARLIVCQQGLEGTVGSPGAFAYSATVVAVDLAIEGRPTAAAVGWIEGRAPDSRARVQLFDQDGCPVVGAMDPGFAAPPVTFGLSLAWSPSRRELLSVFHDFRSVHASWISSATPGAMVTLDEAALILTTAATIGADGRGLVVWSRRATATDVVEERTGVRGLVFGADDEPSAVQPFDVPLPSEYVGASFDVSSGDETHALAFSSASSPIARAVGYAAELSADSGAVVTGPFRLQPESSDEQLRPSVARLADQTWLLTWMSGHRQGAVARLFGSGGTRRFNSVTCDSTSFDVGARTGELLQGTPVSLRVQNEVWILHPAQAGHDPFGLGVVAWSMPWHLLWPAER